MTDEKKPRVRPALYQGEANRGEKPNGATRTTRSTATSDRRNSEQQGGEAFRRWLSRDNTRPTQRSPLGASIYSWRGYNNWAKKIRQTWEADEPVDS